MKMLGLALGVLLLTSGCVTGYQWSGPVEERVGRYVTLERCQQDPRVTRCERGGFVATDGLSSPSMFLPGGPLSNP